MVMFIYLECSESCRRADLIDSYPLFHVMVRTIHD